MLRPIHKTIAVCDVCKAEVDTDQAEFTTWGEITLRGSAGEEFYEDCNLCAKCLENVIHVLQWGKQPPRTAEEIATAAEPLLEAMDRKRSR